MQFDCHEVRGVCALHADRIAVPPGKVPSELKGLKIREDEMIEEPAQFARIVAAYLECVPGLVARTACSPRLDDGCRNLIPDTRIQCHNTPP